MALAFTAVLGRLLIDALSNLPSYPSLIAKPTILSPHPIMSSEPSTSTLKSDFTPIFNAALETYKRKTNKDLAAHPLLPSLQSCDSPDAVLTVLRERIPAFGNSQNDDDGLTKWVTPTVNVLYSFLDTLGQGVGLVNIKFFSREEFLLSSQYLNTYFQAFPAANAIFAGIGVLLSVGVLHISLMQAILTPRFSRRLKIPVLARTSSLRFSTVSNVSSIALRYT